MTHRALERRAQRGIALIVVLGAVVLTTTSLVALAGLARTTSLHAEMDAWSGLGDDLGVEAEKAIRWWLSHRSSQAVTPADASLPAVPVLRASWQLGGTPASLTITAWDQCGMVPLEAIRRSSPLRGLLPERVLRLAEPLAEDGVVPGLDLIQAGTFDPVFPQATDAEPRTDAEDETPAEDVPVGALVSTHSREVLINVNTAPMALVHEAFRLAGRGGAEAVENSRAARRHHPIVTGAGSPNPADPRPRLAGVSRAWSFRIDVTVGGSVRSWWSTWTKDTEWSCRQRLAIAH
jgi:hypothetical protein